MSIIDEAVAAFGQVHFSFCLEVDEHKCANRCGQKIKEMVEYETFMRQSVTLLEQTYKSRMKNNLILQLNEARDFIIDKKAKQKSELASWVDEIFKITLGFLAEEE